jgi:hypothetical protein
LITKNISIRNRVIFSIPVLPCWSKALRHGAPLALAVEVPNNVPRGHDLRPAHPTLATAQKPAKCWPVFRRSQLARWPQVHFGRHLFRWPAAGQGPWPRDACRHGVSGDRAPAKHQQKARRPRKQCRSHAHSWAHAFARPSFLLVTLQHPRCGMLRSHCCPPRTLFNTMDKQSCSVFLRISCLCCFSCVTFASKLLSSFSRCLAV